MRTQPATGANFGVSEPRRLLIVQRNPAAARAISRFLEPLFDDVQVAESRSEAEEILRDPRRQPTHLICGQDLGPGTAVGSSLIPRWRELCPALVQVVLATGAVSLPAQLPGVDAVFQKPAQPSELLSHFAA